jgi:hypothetical protein
MNVFDFFDIVILPLLDYTHDAAPVKRSDNFVDSRPDVNDTGGALPMNIPQA